VWRLLFEKSQQYLRRGLIWRDHSHEREQASDIFSAIAQKADFRGNFSRQGQVRCTWNVLCGSIDIELRVHSLGVGLFAHNPY